MCFSLFNKNEKLNEKELKCPKCGRILKKINKQDIIIDVCPKCKGMWLDDKEIDKLLKIMKDKRGK